MTYAETNLKDIIFHGGVQMDVFKADRTLKLLHVISKNAELIYQQNFGPFFGSLQGDILPQSLILALSRLFDVPRRNKLRSIPAATRLMKNNARNLQLRQRHTLLKKMFDLGYAESNFHKLSDVDVTLILAEAFEKVPPTLNTTLNDLKTYRNKFIAHPEIVQIQDLPALTYVGIDSVLSHAKDFVGMVGLSYLNITYLEADGTYFLSRDAQAASVALERLLKKAALSQMSPNHTTAAMDERQIRLPTNEPT